jgi:hypothetical protein
MDAYLLDARLQAFDGAELSPEIGIVPSGGGFIVAKDRLENHDSSSIT